MGICTFTRDLARFQARQATEAEADASLERECALVRSICSMDELESVARGAEITVLEALVERLAERRILRAQAEAADSAAADRYEAMREHCF